MKKNLFKLFASAIVLLAMTVACDKETNGDTNAPGGNNEGGNTQFEAVDLGLPSGTKWASMNLGATSVTDAGDYYAWGEVEPYYTGTAQNPSWKSGKTNGYAWESYRFAGEYNQQEDEWTLTKYVTDPDYGEVDGKTQLESADDAATAKLGGNWRMPTLEEFQELQDYASVSETTVNGVPCLKVQSRRNNNYIIMPYAYGYQGTQLSDEELMRFWTSTCNGNTGAQAGQVSAGGIMRVGDERCVGFVVRPVCK